MRRTPAFIDTLKVPTYMFNENDTFLDISPEESSRIFGENLMKIAVENWYNKRTDTGGISLKED